MKRTDQSISKAMRDVWAWKEAVYREVQNLPVEQALSAILDSAEQTTRSIKSRSQPKRRRKSAPA